MDITASSAHSMLMLGCETVYLVLQLFVQIALYTTVTPCSAAFGISDPLFQRVYHFTSLLLLLRLLLLLLLFLFDHKHQIPLDTLRCRLGVLLLSFLTRISVNCRSSCSSTCQSCHHCPSASQPASSHSPKATHRTFGALNGHDSFAASGIPQETDT